MGQLAKLLVGVFAEELHAQHPDSAGALTQLEPRHLVPSRQN